MASNRKKKPLYEVIRQERTRSDYQRRMDKLEPKGAVGTEKGFNRMQEKLRPWLKGPKIFQLISGRVEISMPYQLAAAVSLCLVLLILIAFRLGQSYGYGTAERKFNLSGLSQAQPTETTAKEPLQLEKAAVVNRTVETESEKGPAAQTGNNRVVIQTYAIQTQLEPVKKYFAENGIETEIRKIGNIYYLVTKDKYQNPERKGTDGYKAKQKIIEIGAMYKAPQGYETFGKEPFNDAYGMRFDD